VSGAAFDTLPLTPQRSSNINNSFHRPEHISGAAKSNKLVVMLLLPAKGWNQQLVDSVFIIHRGRGINSLCSSPKIQGQILND
jgi:hypothetical protein